MPDDEKEENVPPASPSESSPEKGSEEGAEKGGDHGRLSRGGVSRKRARGRGGRGCRV